MRLTATAGSYSGRADPATVMLLLKPPRLTPAAENRATWTLRSPPGRVRVQATTNSPTVSMATAGAESTKLVLLTMMSPPTGLPAALYSRTRMSVSAPALTSVHAITDRPEYELAVAASNWLLGTLTLTAVSGPM